jgi:endonuclease/exonuclease/phosphatase (EEP) superfamily protein YafD
MTPPKGHLTILQYNAAQAWNPNDSLSRIEADWDIIAIQEPCMLDFDESNPTAVTIPTHHRIILPTLDTRVALYIHKKIDPATWNVITNDKHIQAVRITPSLGPPYIVANVYRQQNNDRALHQLHDLLVGQRSRRVIAVGDFNAHSRRWSPAAITPAQHLSVEKLMDEHALTQLVPKGTTTRMNSKRRERDTTIDLVFITRDFTNLRYKIDIGTDYGSDHLPVISHFEGLTPSPADIMTSRDWTRINVELLRSSTTNRLEPEPGAITTVEQLEQATNDLIAAIEEAINIAVPLRIIHKVYSKPGFPPEFKQRFETRNQMKNQARRRPDYHNLRTEFEEYHKQLRKDYRKWARKQHVDKVVEANIDTTKAFRLLKNIKNSQQFQSFKIDNLIVNGQNIQTPEGKGEALIKSFFPTPLEADLSDIPNQITYPIPYSFPTITADEIGRAIKGAASRKAPGGDGIANETIKALVINADQSVLRDSRPMKELERIFNASVDLGHYPRHFHLATTIALQKQGKTAEQKKTTKAYRPIALLNTVGKILESVIAERIHFYLEVVHISPPPTHFGGRKNRSADEALHFIVETIYTAWNQGYKVTIISLDVSGAFDYVSHPRLLHNLRKRGFGGKWAAWIHSFLSDRQIQLRMPDWTSDIRDIKAGIPQGSPLSPPLYILFNADLVELGDPIVTLDWDMARWTPTSHKAPAARSAGWIDDINYMVIGETAYRKIKTRSLLLQCAIWSKKHGSLFDFKKFQLLHFVPPGTRRTKEAAEQWSTTYDDPQTGNSYIIEPAKEKYIKILGVYLDPRLTWHAHIEEKEKSAKKTLGMLRRYRISTSEGGNMESIRNLYLATTKTIFTYACSIWGQSSIATSTFTGIQQEAAQIISGAWKRTSTAALNVELSIQPAGDTIADISWATAQRIISNAHSRWISQMSKSTDKYKSPLTQLLIKNADERLEILDLNYPIIFSPWQPVPSIHIATDKEKAENDQARSTCLLRRLR